MAIQVRVFSFYQISFFYFCLLAGPAPVKSYLPNDFGLYNVLGNVWEWASGGDPQHRILRGGSFLDSVDGSFNHIVLVSTKQINPGDSGASNIGFRCAGKYQERPKVEDKDEDEL